MNCTRQAGFWFMDSKTSCEQRRCSRCPRIARPAEPYRARKISRVRKSAVWVEELRLTLLGGVWAPWFFERSPWASGVNVRRGGRLAFGRSVPWRRRRPCPATA
jgi:hypothetical protein